MTACKLQVHIAKVKPHNMLQYGYRLLCPHCHNSKCSVEGSISANETALHGSHVLHEIPRYMMCYAETPHCTPVCCS